ncbi:MAG: nitrilase-related carbon-nitrogen hydrolase, partial [Patescibacteria group bacterium]
NMILPVLAAILGIAAFLPFGFSWLFGFIFLAPLFVFFIRENNFWRLIGGAAVFRLIVASGAVYYTLEPITWGLSILIFAGLPVSVYFIKKFLNRFNDYLVYDSRFLIFFLPFLWTFFDHFQARYTLLPNYITTAGNSLGSSPFLGLAAFGGLIFLTFFTALINALFAVFIFKIKSLNSKFYILNSFIIILIIFLGWQVSRFELRKNAENYASLENSLKIAVVSANENFDLQSLSSLENDLSNEKEINLLILPEDIFNNSVKADFFQNLAKKLNINLNVTLDTGQKGERYNSSLLIDNQGEIVGIHHKSRLTFMGEYWPFKNWRPFYLNWLKKNNSEIGNYVVFNSDNPYRRGEKNLLTIRGQTDSINFASLICLEIHYPADLKKYKKMGVKFLINPTSNRWADIGLKHFLYLAANLKKIESVWLETPIVFSGVNDFAGLAAPDGITRLVDFEEKNKNYGLFVGE